MNRNRWTAKQSFGAVIQVVDVFQAIKEKGYDLTGTPGHYLYLLGGCSGPERAVVTCDCAEPKSISDLQDNGIKALACHKEPGCVEYRMKWLQHRRIVIDPARTPNAHREFVAYSYETDKDRNILARLPDKDNHTIDAAAYALDKLIYYKGYRHKGGESMVYMEIHCHNCGISWKVGIADDYHRDGARTCPRCGKQIDRQTWDKQVLPALGAVHDANFELARDATGYKDGKRFTINVLSGAEPGKGTK